jgi:hypothetical protein
VQRVRILDIAAITDRIAARYSPEWGAWPYDRTDPEGDQRHFRPDRRARRSLEPDPARQRHPRHLQARADRARCAGSGVYLYDAEGKSYLDFGSGIAVNSLGYDDPGPQGRAARRRRRA